MLSRSIGLTLMLLSASAASGETVRLVIEPCGKLPSVSMHVAALPDLEGDPASPSLVERSGPLDEPLELPLAADRTWRLYVESSGFWSEPGRVLDPAMETVVRLPAFPRSVLGGRLTVARGEGLPREVVLRISPAGRPGEAASAQGGTGRCALEEAVVTCPVDDEGEFACAIPAGRWNVRLKAEGWAGRHFWDLQLEPQRPHQVGDVELRHGSTLLGEVATVDGPADSRITHIRIERLSGREPGRGADPAIRELAATARLNPQGFFVFEDLTPGAYTVVAHQPGYAPSAPLHVEVVENRETALREPIVLRPPLRLSAQIEPPVDPEGERWRIDLARRAPGGEQLDLAASGRADDEGRWEAEDLPPGRYRLEVVDGAGNSFAVEDPILLETGEGLELVITVELVRVSGVVLVGEDPLSGAEIWFGGQFGPTRIRAAVDEEGRFASYLPKPGRWLIDVLSEEPRVVHEDRSLEVPDGGGELEIRLPDTRLRGRVVEDGSGRPAGGSVVRVARVDVRTGSSGVPTDADGRFDVLALDSGRYVVQAEKEEARSEMVTIDLREGVVPPELTLALRRRSRLEGLVLSPHGGVPGARVEVLPLSASGELVEMSVPSASTDAAGRFVIEVPSETREVLITVLPPGFGLTLRRAAVDQLRIAVAPSEGTLRIVRAASEDGTTADGDIELVIVDGQPVDVPTLVSWLAMHGGAEGGDELVVPALPAGPYRYCLVRFEEALAVFAGLAIPTRCTGGNLTPGGELRLSAP